MNAKKMNPEELRTQAEARLAILKKIVAEPDEIEKLLYELQVHQIELELQNEELRRTQLALEEARDRYFNLYEFAPVAYLTLSDKGLIEEINLTGARLFGIERQKLLHRRFAGFVDSADSDRWYLFFNQLLKQHQHQAIDLVLIPPSGTTFHAQLDCMQLSNHGNHPVLRVALTDISERMQIEMQLRVAATAFESQEGMIIADANYIILRVNKAFSEITGYSAEEVIGQHPHILQSGCHDKAFYKAMWQSITETGAWKGDIWDKRKNGEVYPVHLTITAVKDQNDIVSHYVATLIDITASKAASDKIEHLAFYDSLTDLPNRRLLMDRLKLALASSQRTGKYGALLFIDMDNFKLLNDTLGHDMGDLLLQQIAERLMCCVRENDTVARLGGDEFVVMLEDLSEQKKDAAMQTETIAEKILSTLNQTHQLASHTYHNTPSIGAILFKGHKQSIEELMKQVDIAMYQAKTSGRNTIRFFDPSMQAGIDARVALEADLRLAIKNNQFKLYYQAQTTYDNKIIGAEVLIRWQHPKHGLILPADFIPLLEETGLILPMGYWALESVCQQLKHWEQNERTAKLQIAVNVSAKQFHQADFVEQVCEIIERYAIKPDLLKLELTESLLLDNIEATINKMHTLRNMGIHFSMDDFGTGYSSLSYLTKLPLDQLKIDCSFVHNIGITTADALIVQTIIGMTKNLGIDVIAEGVETEEQHQFLKQHGCHFYQGFLFNKPMPIEQFEAVLMSQ